MTQDLIDDCERKFESRTWDFVEKDLSESLADASISDDSNATHVVGDKRSHITKSTVSSVLLKQATRRKRQELARGFLLTPDERASKM